MTQLANVRSSSARSGRRLRHIGLIASLVAFLLPELGEAQKKNVFHSETNLVVLHATVRNARGELVTDLTQDAFSIFDNGARQKIALFRRDDIPVSLGLLIDNSGSMRALRPKVEAAALACVKASHHDDEAFVLNFGDKPQLDVPMTSDVRVLESGLARVDSIGGTALRDTVKAGAQYLIEQAHRERSVLLIITDGNDNASMTSVAEIRRLAEEHEITVYAIGLLNDEDPSRARRARHELDELTRSTGGAAYYPPSIESIEATALEIAREIRNRYTIAFYRPSQRLDGSYRKLRLVVRGPSPFEVRTRGGYWATP